MCGHCMVLCGEQQPSGDEGEVGVCCRDLTVGLSPMLGSCPKEVPLQQSWLLRARLCCPPVGCSAQSAVWDGHIYWGETLSSALELVLQLLNLEHQETLQRPPGVKVKLELRCCPCATHTASGRAQHWQMGQPSAPGQ